MKINKIKKIIYKSYLDFDRERVCIKKNLQEAKFDKFNIIFWENWSGKSSICEIFKSISLSDGFSFDNIKPEKIILEVETIVNKENKNPQTWEIFIKTDKEEKIYTYEQDLWNNNLDKDSLLFFDVDYINKNIHTHWERLNTQWHHTQNSWKLIIALDEQANNMQEEINNQDIVIQDYKEINKGILSHKLEENDYKIYNLYKDETIEKIELHEIELKEKNNLLREKEKKINELKNKFNEISTILLDQTSFSEFSLPSQQLIQELFDRKIQQIGIASANITIKEHFDKHKNFLVKDDNYKKITENVEWICPLCSQKLENIDDVIKYYNSVFDTSYETARTKHIQDITKLSTSLKDIITQFSMLWGIVQWIFWYFEEISKKYWVEDIYNMDLKKTTLEDLNKISIPTEIQTLIELLWTIWTLTWVNIESQYFPISNFINEINQLLWNVKKYQKESNDRILQFKSQYSDILTIEKQLWELNIEQQNNGLLLSFFKENKKTHIEKYEKAKTELKRLEDIKKEKESQLEKYLQEKIPKDFIERMIKTLKRFNLPFTLQHLSASKRANDYTFWFKVIDDNWFERNLKKWLSEWERQLISLAFFFAMNDNISNKDKKILILDDPITSLDSPNLKILADIVTEQISLYEQVIVFTHHPLFYKYLSKFNFPNPIRFWIFKNRPELWWSFIFFEGEQFCLDTELKKHGEEIKKLAESWNLKNEEVCLKYWQLLRLAVEKLIKYDLLMRKEDNFEHIADKLKSSNSQIRKLDDTDIDTITNIYKYCNYSNLMHIDKESPSTISELINYINIYLKIKEKLNS